MSADTKDLLKRAAWTFVQTFLSVFLVAIPAIVESLQLNGFSGSKALLISAASGAVGAGLSAVKTLFVNRWTQK